MKRITVLVLILALLAAPFTGQAASLSDIGDKPEPAPRVMPDPTITYIPYYGSNIPSKFLGKIILPNGTTGLGYEYSSFPSDSWDQAKALIRYNNRLIAAGYDAPSLDQFDGDNQQYLCFSANNKPSVYLLPYLKKSVLIAIVRYDNDILDVFPDDMSADAAYAALIAKLDSEDTLNSTAKKLAAMWKTSSMSQAVTNKITADNMDTLLPALIRGDFFTQFNADNGEVKPSASVTEIGKVIQSIISSQGSANDKLFMAKKVAGTVLPAVDDRYLQVTSLVWNSSDMQDITVTDALPPIPEFDSGTDIPADLNDDGAAHKYVIVSEYNGAYRLMPCHAVFLPADEIAESIEEADRIIVCHNYYKPSSGNWTGGRPNDSLTRINLYDAETGSLICNIGFAGNYQGFISHGGIPHDWIEIGEDIMAYFAK